MDLLFEILNKRAEIDQADFDLLLSISMKKNEFWIREGMFAQEVAYVQNGYLRKYYLQEGNEVTDYFYLENSFTGDLPSILSSPPTYSYVEAMEPSELVVWNYDRLNALAKQSHKIEHLLRKFTETGFVTFYNRTKSFITQSPKERYQAIEISFLLHQV